MGKLLAPNGKPSNLTPEQYKLVRTPEFKAWFGDWENDPVNASKVVDENGEPMVCYHATDNKFWEFSKEKQIVGYYGKGFYFTNSLEKSKQYGKRVIPAFLNIKSVFELSDETPQELLNELAEASVDVVDMGEENDIEQRSKYTFGYASENSDIFMNNLIKNGYYGIKMIYDLESTTYFFIVFESNQIKLADGTNTTFDGNNPDIRFEDGGDISKSNEFIGSWEQLKKENPNLWETGILRKNQNPQGATDIIPKDVHIRQGQWQNYGQYDEIEAETIYGKPDSYGYYNDEYGNPIIDERTGNYLKDEFDYENNAERIKATISNKQLKSNLIDSFETEQGKEYLKKVIANLPKNEDGTITAYRIGTIDEGIQSYTLSEGMAKTFSNQGTDIMPSVLPSIPNEGYKEYGVLPVNNVKINPKGIVAWSPYDSEILVESKYVKTYKNNNDVRFKMGGKIQPRDLTQIENYRNIYKGAEFYTFSDNPEKVEKADRWFELFRTNQKERQLTAEEFVEFMQLSNELSWEEFSNGGGVEWDAERYRQVEREMYELRQQGKVDTPEYFKLIKERSILEQSKLKNPQNKDMETGHLDINTTYAKGGKILAKVVEVDGEEKLVHDQLARFQRIGITDAYTIEAINEIGLQGVNFDEKTIIKRISAQFENLLNTYEDYIINEDSEAITFDMKNDIKTKKREGASLETLAKMENDVNNPIARQEKINKIADGQKEALMTWVGYLRQSEYSVSFKCVMLNAVLKYNYDLNENKIFERDNKTIRNFTPFDAGVLAQLYQSKSNFLLMDYTMIMNEQSKLVLNSREVIEESGNGKWVKFNGGKSTAEKIRIENARELSKLVQNTYWCTKNNAKTQLDGGDFYVYVTENNGEIMPRIAVRMEEQRVGEVRGNKNKDQAIEDEMLPIAEEFLLRNIPNDSGVRWLNSIYYNTRCIELTERIENEGFFKDFIDEYIKIVGGEQMFNTDYGRNGNVQLLKEVVKSKLENLPNEFFEVGDITDEISKLNRRTKYFIGDLDSYNMERVLVTYGINEDLNTWDLIGVSGSLDLTKTKNLGKIKIVGGNMTCGSDLQNLGNVTYVGGRLDISKNDLITSLDNIEHIGTSLEINKTEVDAITGANRKKSNLQNLGKLKVIYGNLTLLGVDETFDLGDLEHIKGNFSIGNGSGNIDLKNIKRIDGQCMIGLCEVTDLKNIEHIGTNFSIARSKVKVFDKLKFIGGNADFSNNFTTSTQNIETILGDIKFLNSRIMEFPKLRKVGGEMDMRGSYFKSLGNIKYIGGNLDLATSKLEDLGELQYVGGFVNFKGTKIENLNNLKKIVKFVNFEGSNVVDLGNLETIGGNAYFNNSKVESLGNLKYIGGFAQFNNKSELEQKWLERSKK